MRALIDEGAVERKDGALRATSKLESVAIPDSVQEVILVRVDGLALGPRSVLHG